MTRIVFDSQGRPHWLVVPASQGLVLLHNLNDYRDKDVPFTQDDKDWFRKPLSHTERF